MLDHVSIGVKELERSRRFYDAALKPLGLVRTLDFGRGSDWGAAAGQSGGGEFTITLEGTLAEPKAQRAGESASRVRKPRIVPSLGLHLCFRARDRAAVREFYRAALAHGGRDDGAPGLRP
ncbi:MAG: VOC family protein, partial [Candidatus Binataceae bacterium]